MQLCGLAVMSSSIYSAEEMLLMRQAFDDALAVMMRRRLDIPTASMARRIFESSRRRAQASVIRPSFGGPRSAHWVNSRQASWLCGCAVRQRHPSRFLPQELQSPVTTGLFFVARSAQLSQNYAHSCRNAFLNLVLVTPRVSAH
jgi:hypothetical protein